MPDMAAIKTMVGQNGSSSAGNRAPPCIIRPIAFHDAGMSMPPHLIALPGHEDYIMVLRRRVLPLPTCPGRLPTGWSTGSPQE